MSRYDQMRKAAIDYHKAHPEVFQLFVRFAFELKRRGFKHYGTNAVFHRIRWHSDKPRVDGASTFKLNNNHAPFYARAAMKKYPELDGFFRLRKQTSEDRPDAPEPELDAPDWPYLPPGEYTNPGIH